MPGPLGAYLGQFSVNAMAMAVSNVPNVNIAAGDYYPAGYSGEGSVQFAAAVQTGIRQVPGQGNANVALSLTSGRYSLALNTAANISFLTDRLANIMGWSNGLVQPSAAVHTAPSQARYLWRPSRAPSDHPLGIAAPLAPRSSTLYGRAPDGTTYSVKGSQVYDGFMEYHSLAGDEVKTPDSGTVYADLQQWWSDVAHEGMPFRFVMNRSQYAATADYVTCVWSDEGQEELGAFVDVLSRLFKGYNGLWNGRVPLMKKV